MSLENVGNLLKLIKSLLCDQFAIITSRYSIIFHLGRPASIFGVYDKGCYNTLDLCGWGSWCPCFPWCRLCAHSSRWRQWRSSQNVLERYVVGFFFVLVFWFFFFRQRQPQLSPAPVFCLQMSLIQVDNNNLFFFLFHPLIWCHYLFFENWSLVAASLLPTVMCYDMPFEISSTTPLEGKISRGQIVRVSNEQVTVFMGNMHDSDEVSKVCSILVMYICRFFFHCNIFTLCLRIGLKFDALHFINVTCTQSKVALNVSS